MSKHHPPKGYNWAVFKVGNLTAQEATDIMLAGDATLVLAEAEGVQGVLRALQTRMGRIVLTEARYTLAYFKFPPDCGGACILHLWGLDAHPKREQEDDQTNYARTHPTTPIHPSKMIGGAA